MAEPFLNCPKDWLRGTLEPNSSLGIIKRVDSGGTPSTRNPDYWDGPYPWLTPKEITGISDGIFVTKTERTITQIALNKSAAKLMPPGTVMLTKRAPVGTVTINAVPMATNQGFLNFQCGPKLRPLFLAYWFRINTPYLDIVANGSTYPELYKSDLFEFEIAIPSLDMQDKILSVISALQYISLAGIPLEQSVADPEQMIEMQKLRRHLATIRDRVIPLLFSGELDVSHVNTDFLRALT